MGVETVPVLVWEDFVGFHTAVPVEPGFASLRDAPAPAACHPHRSRALDQLEGYLAWCLRECPWLEPDFLDPELIQVTVPIRPQHIDHDRVYPCDETVDLRLPCVLGRQEQGLLVCSLPTIGLGFHYHDADAIKPLVAEKVRQFIGQPTPQALARLLPTKGVSLAQVSVSRTGRRRANPTWQPSVRQLAAVTRPVGETGFRRSFAAAWERQAEVEQVVQRLGRDHVNVVLVGDRGAGKTTILVQAIREIERTISGRVGGAKQRHWITSASRLIAGMKYLGQWQERCDEIVAELAKIDGVLCVESLLDMALVGGSGSGDGLAAYLLPSLQSGELRMAAEATPAELDACRRLLPGWADLFTVVRVDELDERRARAALGQLAATLARDTGTTMDAAAVAATCRLFRRFLPYRPLPGSAAAFVRDLFDDARQGARASGRPEAAIDAATVTAKFTTLTGLPDAVVRDDSPLAFADVVAALERRVIGQPGACRAAAAVVTAFKAGMNDPGRPLGALLFCGPTGVGKTELARSLADFVFGHGRSAATGPPADERLVRLDMSEYGTPWSALRILTRDDGTPSDLIARLRQQPFTVVLFDEIEKAAAEVFDMLLGVLDEGRLTDSLGRTTDFRSAIVIMTSNLGATSGGSLGFTGAQPAGHEAEVRRFFRPEFFNRLDAVVGFEPLGHETCLAITRKELEAVAAREGLTGTGLRLAFDEGLVAWLTARGFDPRYGARPLQRAIESEVVTALARLLVRRPGFRDADIHIGLDAAGRIEARAGTD